MTNCPKCGKSEIKEHSSVSGVFTRKKTITFYCPLCKFENKKEFKMSKDDLEMEKLNLSNKPKETIHKFISFDSQANMPTIDIIKSGNEDNDN
jgi:hypothetical protein